MPIRDDELNVRPGRIRHRGPIKPKTFVAQVLKAAQKAGHIGERSGRGLPARMGRSTFGRGRIAFARGRLLSTQRRVIVKARIVRHKGPAFRSAPLSAHMAYLKREGVTRDGRATRLFDAGSEATNEAAFAERCQDDRHHFRFTISPEDAAEMTDLKAFARDLVSQVENDLETKLEWVAVDHWNTDNPHVHLLVRGVTEEGRDLVISRDYISHGLRSCAEELVAIELGPKPEHEVRSALEREVTAERWTRLDAAIRTQLDETGLVDLRPKDVGPSDPQIRRLMVGRLQVLERLGLANSAGPAQWVVDPEIEPTLRDLGTRGDIIKTMHRAFTTRGQERPLDDYVIDGGEGTSPIIGRLVDKGLHDELTGEAYAVIDGTDGRAHHVRFRGIEAFEHAPPIGGIVEVRRFVATDNQRATLVLAARSDFDLDAQVTARGATWLDHRLVAREQLPLSMGGFGAETRAAIEARIEHLVGEGLARRQSQRVIFVRNLLDTLRRRELGEAGARLATQNGLPYSEAAAGEYVAGTYRQRVNLTSGRFAVIDNGLGFSLVPWSPSLERKLGQQVSGIARADVGVDWSFGRTRSIGIG
ncbi:Type IV secretory pathway, VirD2 components (relaxase) [Rhizobiales bacterium GAS113]|nr:Type IV secretory pathway, VirD2 components (relaxase) [Rhizobiales bacterium GAS113]